MVENEKKSESDDKRKKMVRAAFDKLAKKPELKPEANIKEQEVKKEPVGNGGKNMNGEDEKARTEAEAVRKARNKKPIDVEKKVISDELDDDKVKVEFGKIDEPPTSAGPPKKTKSYLLFYIILGVLLGAGAALLGLLIPFIILVVGLLIILLLIWFVLAPQNIIWNFTEEATAKIIVRGDSFVWAFIQWEGYTFDEHWNVIPEDEKHKEPWHFGGLRFNGIPLVDVVYWYDLRWKSVRLQPENKDNKGEMVKFHEERLDYVPLRSEVYYTKIFAAETKPPERLAPDIEFLTTIQVTNPYNVLFVAPYNWLENAMIRASALYTNWVGTKLLDEILEIKDKPEKLWADIGENELIQQVFDKEWGVRVAKHGVQIRKVDVPADYQAALAEEKKQKLQAAGRSAETIGSVLSTMAYVRGLDVDKIQKEINASPEKQKEFLEIAKDLITRKLAIEGGSYLDIRTEGAEGLDKTILNALGAWQRMPQGKSPKKKTPEEKESK